MTDRPPPRPLSEARRWLARQLMDTSLSDVEAFSMIAFHPLIQDARDASPAIGKRPRNT
jgi:hypothetical protein